MATMYELETPAGRYQVMGCPFCDLKPKFSSRLSDVWNDYVYAYLQCSRRGHNVFLSESTYVKRWDSDQKKEERFYPDDVAMLEAIILLLRNWNQRA